jgi:hypothetical protein
MVRGTNLSASSCKSKSRKEQLDWLDRKRFFDLRNEMTIKRDEMWYRRPLLADPLPPSLLTLPIPDNRVATCIHTEKDIRINHQIEVYSSKQRFFQHPAAS